MVFFNLLHRPLGLKVLVCLSRLAFPEVLDLLALQQHLLDQLLPKKVRKGITQAVKHQMKILFRVLFLLVSMYLWPIWSCSTWTTFGSLQPIGPNFTPLSWRASFSLWGGSKT